MDEVHIEYFGQELSKTIIEGFLKNVSKPIVVMGLSATPTKQAIEKLGRLLYFLTSLRAMKEGILVGKLKIYRKRTKTDLRDTNKDPWKVAVIERAERFSEEIIKILLEEAKRLYPREDNPLTRRIPKTLIVAANVVEANDIAKGLREKISELRGDDCKDELVRVAHYRIENAVDEINRFREGDEGILVTVNMANVGFDDKDLEVLVIARPIRTAVAYTQIRGRVLRRSEREHENIKKVLGYAVLIDLTGASDHEESVDDAELGELFVENLDEIKYDLEGEDEVERVRGEVDIEDYGIIEVPQELVEARDRRDIEKEILSILKLPYGLTSKKIQQELKERGYNLTIREVEKVCRKLFGEGVLERRYDTWFYSYKHRLINIITQVGDKEEWTIEELMKETGISSRDQVQATLQEIIREKVKGLSSTLDMYSLSEQLKISIGDLIRIIPHDILDIIGIITFIARDCRKICTLPDLDSLLREKLNSNDSWLVVYYPLRFKRRVYEILSDTGVLNNFFESKEELDNELCRIFLKRFSSYLVIVKGCGRRIPCNTLREVLESITSLSESGCREIEVSACSQEVITRIRWALSLPQLLDLPLKLQNFILNYHHDPRNNKITITLKPYY